MGNSTRSDSKRLIIIVFFFFSISLFSLPRSSKPKTHTRTSKFRPYLHTPQTNSSHKFSALQLQSIIITITTLSFHPPPPPFQYSSLVPFFYRNHPSSHSAEQQSEHLPTIPFVMPAFHPLNPARTPEVTLAVLASSTQTLSPNRVNFLHTLFIKSNTKHKQICSLSLHGLSYETMEKPT